MGQGWKWVACIAGRTPSTAQPVPQGEFLGESTGARGVVGEGPVGSSGGPGAGGMSGGMSGGGSAAGGSAAGGSGGSGSR